MNLRDLSPHVLYLSLGAGKATPHLKSINATMCLQQKGTVASLKCRTYNFWKSGFKWDTYSKVD